MFSLLSEIHFWTCDDHITVKDSDYGVYKYQDRKDNIQNIIHQSKKEYAEKRNYYWTLPNKRPNKIKEKLRELEDQIHYNKIVYCEWRDVNVIKIILNSGLIVNIGINGQSGDIQKISFDKYLIGKLLSENVTDVLVTKNHLIITYNDNQCTLLNFSKPIFGVNPFEKLNKFEPKVSVCELAGPPGRKLERKLCISESGDILITWWKCLRDEVYPWSPVIKDHDRANIHIYHVFGSRLDLICYRRTESEPINISFSKENKNIIFCVEQKVSRKGQVTIEITHFEIVRNKLEQLTVTSIPLQTQICCHAFSPDNEKLLIGCIDGSIALYDQGRGVTHFVKAAFIPSLLSWHTDGAIFVVANEKCNLQFFDISLTCVKLQIVNEESSPNNILDLTTYFRNQPSLLRVNWNKKVNIEHFCSRFLETDSFLLIFFEKGPLATLRLFCSAGLKGDIQGSGLTPDNLIFHYISKNQIDQAIFILSNLSWEKYGISCLMSLQRIVNHLFRQKLIPERENQIQKALGTFYSLNYAISSSVLQEFGDQVKDIARKFFHLLTRYCLFEKAFLLAIDINDYDLFMDLYYYADDLQNTELANASLTKAKEIINSNESSDSTCSKSSCSECSTEDFTENNSVREWNNQNFDIPPLPITKIDNSSIKLSTYKPPLPITKNSNAQFNFPKPVSAPKIPTPPQNSQFFSNNFQKISITNTNFIKPRLDFNPMNHFSRPTYQLGAYDQSLRLKTPNLNQTNQKVQLQGSLDHVFRPLTNVNNNFLSNQTATPREIVHKTISFNIPPPPSVTNTVKKISTTPQFTNSNSNSNLGHFNNMKLGIPVQSSSGLNKNSTEKNVKFSDTVTAFIVPEIQRTAKPIERPKRPGNVYLTDPKQELADSLPLCHPNEDYLKDFTPISNTQEEEGKKSAPSKIQVVHFGMV